MIPTRLIKKFPKLQNDLIANIVGKGSFEYNCVTYAMGGNHPNIWPSSIGPISKNIYNTDTFWPTDLTADETIENFLIFLLNSNMKFLMTKVIILIIEKLLFTDIEIKMK